MTAHHFLIIKELEGIKLSSQEASSKQIDGVLCAIKWGTCSHKKWRIPRIYINLKAMRQIHRRKKNKLLKWKVQPLNGDDPEPQIAVHWETKLGKPQHFALLFCSSVGICFWPDDALLNRLRTSVPLVNYFNTPTRWTHPVKRPCYNWISYIHLFSS